MKRIFRSMMVASILIAFPFTMNVELTSNTIAQDRESTQKVKTLANIDAAIENALQQKEVVGAVTLVIENGQVAHFNAQGLADVASNRPMTKDTIFWIASMSKPVAGACVMVLVDEGKLKLSDTIDQYLPEMANLKNDQGEVVKVTVQQLLNHTSGMRELKQPYIAANLEEAAKEYANVGVQFPPGSKWQYSQTSINTAARIVEVLSGMSYDKFVAEKLCKPLEMVDTSFYLSDAQAGRLATSYARAEDGSMKAAEIGLLAGKRPTDRSRMPAANGGLFSTANDYGNFCTMLLSEGEFKGKRVLSRDAVKRLRTPNTGDLTVGFTDGNAWGVGACVVQKPQGVSEVLSPGSFGHGGAHGTQAWIDPTKKRAYILLVQRSNFPNSDNSDIRRAFQGAAAQSLNK